jgi:hypothetical protein
VSLTWVWLCDVVCCVVRVLVLGEGSRGVSALAFSPDGHTLAVASQVRDTCAFGLKYDYALHSNSSLITRSRYQRRVDYAEDSIRGIKNLTILMICDDVV